MPTEHSDDLINSRATAEMSSELIGVNTENNKRMQDNLFSSMFKCCFFILITCYVNCLLLYVIQP